MPTPAIEVNHLHFHFPKERKLFDDVNFEIAQNECIGVIGPNGGGKTTLLQLLLGFYTPQQGSIQFHSQRKDSFIGYVPQAFRFDTKFPITCKEVVLGGLIDKVSFLGTFSHQAIEKAHKAMERLDILDLKDLPIGALSGGQMQRAFFARAIVNNPEVLILDEPTASVDPYAEKLIFDLISNLKGKCTIIIVTHELPGLISLADRVFLVQRGVDPVSKEKVCSHVALGLYHKKDTLT